MSELRSGTPHRGWEVYYRVTDPLHSGVGGVTLATQHLKRGCILVPAKL